MKHKGLQLDWERDWCSAHLEPFRPRWPHGATIGAMMALSVFVHDKEVQTYCDGDSNKLEAALAEFGPMCCRIFQPTMEEITLTVLRSIPTEIAALRQRLMEKGK
jgi:hypothetical protein